MKLSNKKHNWALKTGIPADVIPVFALLFLVIANPDLFVEFYKETESDYFFGSKLAFLSSLIWMAFIAPVYEEMVFDGAFLKNKALQVIGYVGLIAFTLYFNISIYSVGLLVLFLVLSYLYCRKTKSEKIQNLRIIVNALLFSVIHLDFPNDVDWLFFVSLLSRFGGHLLSLWLVLNYKLIYGILYHVIWNTVLAIGILFATDFNPQPGKLRIIENDVLKIEYQEAADFNEKRIRLGNPHHWKYRSVGIDEIYYWFPNRYAIEEKYVPKKPALIYNFDVYIKDSSLVDNRKILQSQFIELLIKDSLIVDK